MNEYKPINSRGCRHILVVTDIFIHFGCTVRLKNKCAQTITDVVLKLVQTSKRKPNLFETDDGMEYVKYFNDFLEPQVVKIYSRHTSEVAVFAEKFHKMTRKSFLKKPVFEK